MDAQIETMTAEPPPSPRDLSCLDDKLGLWLRVAQKRFIEQVNRRFASHKVSHLDFLVMTLVDRNPGCRLMLLAQNLRLQPPNVAKVVDDLVARGILAKVADPVDRRANRLSVGEGGAALLQTLRREHDQLKQEAMRDVDPTAREQLLPLLRSLIRGMRPSQSRPAAKADSWP